MGMNPDDFEVTDEQIADVEKVVDAMINGGDFSDISYDVFQEVQGKINLVLENDAKEADMPMGLNDWVLKRKGVEQTPNLAKTYGLENEKIVLDNLSFELPKLNLLEPKLVLFDEIEEKLQLGDLGYPKKESILSEKIYLDPSEEKFSPDKVTIAQEAMMR